jgi:iron complex transport system ATP-binding protein
MVTHDLQLTGSIFDSILAMRCGEVAAQGTPLEVLSGELLSEIYGEPNVRTQRIGGQTLIWIEA